MPLLGSYTITVGNLAAASATQTLWVSDGNYQVAAVSCVFSTAGGSLAAATVSVDTGTQAPGAGAAQLTGTMALTGVANTVVTGTVIASPTSIVAGNRIAVVLSGTLTGLVGLTVTVTLKAV